MIHGVLALSLMRTLLLALFVLGLSAGCGDVEQCQRGEPGCLAGPAVKGRCSHGLVNEHGACVEPGAGPVALSCRCDEGEVCTLDGYRCVDYCAPLEVAIGTAAPRTNLSCAAAALSFDQLCENRCLIRCRQWRELCPGSASCNEESCRSAAEHARCQSDCGNVTEPARCMAALCSEVQGQGCSDLACPEQTHAVCGNVQCRNNCVGFNFDGVCDDGDLASAASGACAFGTDCADCGPRHGPTPKLAAQGEPCAFHTGCAGNDVTDLAHAAAWCVEIQPGVSRCAPDCSSEDEICPEGSLCFTLSGFDQDGDDEPDPITHGQRTASACFPVMCH